MLNESQMTTVMKEIEAVVNSRPLTYVDTELSHILKPSDFLTTGRTLTVEELDGNIIPQGTQTRSDLIEGWKRGLTIHNEFKEMFVNRYLTSLRERPTTSPNQPRVTSKLTPVEGQIVQIKGDSKNREGWKVGKITALPKGSDGACRIAKINVGDKEFIRSLAHLYPLEIPEDNLKTTPVAPPGKREATHQDEASMDSEAAPADILSEDHDLDNDQGCRTKPSLDNFAPSNDEEKLNPTNDDPDVSPATCRGRRSAAIKAMEKIRLWTQSHVSFLVRPGVSRHLVAKIVNM